MTLRPFHFAFPVHDLEQARQFYTEVIGCNTGRESERWIDFDLHGHQIVAHLKDDASPGPKSHSSVDGDEVPVPHFGLILTTEQWHNLRTKLEALDDIQWVIKPKVRFEGEPGEQATMFLLDPSGNALEFKAFGDDKQIFAAD